MTPFGDGTGPLGEGPVGRGLGPCGGGQRRGRGGRRQGAGQGRRGGAGFGRIQGSNPSPVGMAGKEVEQLRQQAANLQQALDTAQQRLGQLQPKIEPSQTDQPSNKA